MRQSTKELVIEGACEFAEIAYEDFTHDSAFEVKAFRVERTYVTINELFSVPVGERSASPSCCGCGWLAM